MKKFLILALTLLLVFSLVACGSSKESEKPFDNTDKTENTDNSGKTEKPEESAPATQIEKDKQTLEAAGYTVYMITMSNQLALTESVLVAEEGSLTGVINAIRDDIDMNIYYFKTSAQASTCFNGGWNEFASYKLMDSRIVYGDQEGLIK